MNVTADTRSHPPLPASEESRPLHLSDEEFASAIAQHGRSVYRYARSRVGDVQADDVIAETFAAAWKARHKYECRSEESFELWLLGIATNVLRRHRRAEDRWMTMRADTFRESQRRTVPVDEAAEADRRVDAQRSPSEVLRAVKDLSPREREPLLLLALQDLTYDQIASVLRLPVGTVRSRISRARRRIVSQLEKSQQP